MAPVCSNCGASDFVWVNELRTGTIGGGSLSIRSRGELSLGTRLCRNCGHADLFLKDPSILKMPHTWRPGEFVPIPNKPASATVASVPPVVSAPPMAAPPPPPPAPAAPPAAAPPPPSPAIAAPPVDNSAAFTSTSGTEPTPAMAEPAPAAKAPAKRRAPKAKGAA